LYYLDSSQSDVECYYSTNHPWMVRMWNFGLTACLPAVMPLSFLLTSFLMYQDPSNPHLRWKEGLKGEATTPFAQDDFRVLRYTLRYHNISAILRVQRMIQIPLGRVALLLDLCENTLRFIILTMRASRHFAVAFNLLLPTHVASLRNN
jgi:hypothetical protein